MRIAQVAPLSESVPPHGYGGTERVVSYLTEELVRQGHEVTLFASGDSVTRAQLVTCAPRRLPRDCDHKLAHHLVMLERVYAEEGQFDVIHQHVDYLHFPFSRRSRARTITTLHGRLDTPAMLPVYREYPEMPLVSISDSQRRPLPWVNWIATVHHGLPERLHRMGSGGGGYLAFLGRMSPEKRPDRAIEIARRTGMPIKLAAKVDPADRQYFEDRIEPLLGGPGVEFLGEIGEDDKGAFLGGAAALLFPIDWPEPFGVVLIEAMACGTPIVAFRGGSVAEVVEDGVNGFVVDDLEQAVRATEAIGRVPRWSCRAAFEQRFTAERMAHGYVEAYRSLVDDRVRAAQV